VESDPSRKPPLLDVYDLQVGYGRSQVLQGVALTVRTGETVALIGRNGAGKSTFLRAISGLLKPTAGRIRFAGSPIHALPPHRIARLGIAHVREGRKLFRQQTVLENLLMGAYLRRDADVRTDLDAVFESFPVLSLKRRHRASLLSGGEQQILALAQCLMLRPRLLLLDEPSLGLAPLMVEQIFAHISRLKAQGVTILLVEQMVGQALGLCDRAYVLDAGRITLEGTGAELLDNEKVRDTYLGALERRTEDQRA
jgi:branched-chain amino acid transport system ATP-binding protein